MEETEIFGSRLSLEDQPLFLGPNLMALIGEVFDEFFPENFDFEALRHSVIEGKGREGNFWFSLEDQPLFFWPPYLIALLGDVFDEFFS